MSELKFKTNINCGSCLAKVSPLLNAEGGIQNWEVDLESEDRILTVNTEMQGEEVSKTVLKAGFVATELG